MNENQKKKTFLGRAIAKAEGGATFNAVYEPKHQHSFAVLFGLFCSGFNRPPDDHEFRRLRYHAKAHAAGHTVALRKIEGPTKDYLQVVVMQHPDTLPSLFDLEP